MYSSGTKDIERHIVAHLRQKRYKLTAQRLEIIRTLASERSHPGAMDIFRLVRQRVPKVSISTVYYTLEMLKKEGLIGELEFYDRDNRYDVNVSNHINLICKECGKIEDFTRELPFSSEAIEELTGFRPLGMRFEYYGYCKGCRDRRRR